jgi:hypothetical protein
VLKLCLFVIGFIGFGFGEEAEPAYQKVNFYLLNKLSGKRQEISVPLHASYKIKDLRFVPLGCWKTTSPLRPLGDFQAPLQIFLDQDEEAEPILIYEAELSTNHYIIQPPLEHPIYDIILKDCE